MGLSTLTRGEIEGIMGIEVLVASPCENLRMLRASLGLEFKNAEGIPGPLPL